MRSMTRPTDSNFIHLHQTNLINVSYEIHYHPAMDHSLCYQLAYRGKVHAKVAFPELNSIDRCPFYKVLSIGYEMPEDQKSLIFGTNSDDQ